MKMVERREFIGVVEGMTFCSERFSIRKHARSIPRMHERSGGPYRYLPSQLQGFGLWSNAQLKLSPTRRIDLGSTVFGFTVSAP
jgi:hypothetical protein